ncbi:hypothetical protein ACJDU8_21850 [Clostridium sp. WILCCON 0269]|uniref:Uncharacterized protein n=1 Tax=Candidatus Clostridium eludens TaxID=3381663 RepID=A0ABW8SR77_9CLOT
MAKCNLSEYNEISIGFPITISGSIIALFALVMPDNSASTILLVS